MNLRRLFLALWVLTGAMVIVAPASEELVFDQVLLSRSAWEKAHWAATIDADGRIIVEEDFSDDEVAVFSLSPGEIRRLNLMFRTIFSQPEVSPLGSYRNTRGENLAITLIKAGESRRGISLPIEVEEPYRSLKMTLLACAAQAVAQGDMVPEGFMSAEEIYKLEVYLSDELRKAETLNPEDIIGNYALPMPEDYYTLIELKEDQTLDQIVFDYHARIISRVQGSWEIDGGIVLIKGVQCWEWKNPGSEHWSPEQRHGGVAQRNDCCLYWIAVVKPDGEFYSLFGGMNPTTSEMRDDWGIRMEIGHDFLFRMEDGEWEWPLGQFSLFHELTE